jgi:hypothetical protein
VRLALTTACGQTAGGFLGVGAEGQSCLGSAGFVSVPENGGDHVTAFIAPESYSANWRP